jgi:hypothetical protein
MRSLSTSDFCTVAAEEDGSRSVTARHAPDRQRFFACVTALPHHKGVIMSVAGESGGRAQQMRQKAQELKDAAERANDPQERQRLIDKARRMEEQSERESGTGTRGMDPME